MGSPEVGGVVQILHSSLLQYFLNLFPAIFPNLGKAPLIPVDYVNFGEEKLLLNLLLLLPVVGRLQLTHGITFLFLRLENGALCGIHIVDENLKIFKLYIPLLPA